MAPPNVASAVYPPAAAPGTAAPTVESAVLCAAPFDGSMTAASEGIDSLAGTSRVVPSGTDSDSGCVRALLWPGSWSDAFAVSSLGIRVEKASLVGTASSLTRGFVPDIVVVLRERFSGVRCERRRSL